MTPEQRKKLPAYARDRLYALESEVAALKEQLATFSGEESPIEVDPYRRDGLRLYIPEHLVVRYTFPNGHVNVCIRHGRLDINSTAFSPHVMELQPCAANSVSVGFCKR